MDGPLTVESSGTIHLQISVGPVESGLGDTYFVVAVGKLNRPVIFQGNEKVAESNVRDSCVHFDAVGLAKRATERKVAIHDAVAGEIFQGAPIGQKGVEIELRPRKLAGNRLIACQSQTHLPAELAVRSLGIQRQANVLTVRCEPATKISLIIAADFQVHDAEISLPGGSANRSAAAHIEIKLPGEGQRGILQLFHFFQRNARACDVKLDVFFLWPVNNISRNGAGVASKFGLREAYFVLS